MDTNHASLEKDTSLFNFGYIVEFVRYDYDLSQVLTKNQKAQDVSIIHETGIFTYI